MRVGPQVFPLYPGEELEGEITPEYVLGVYEALRLRALNAFTDERAPAGRAHGRERQLPPAGRPLRAAPPARGRAR